MKKVFRILFLICASVFFFSCEVESAATEKSQTEEQAGENSDSTATDSAQNGANSGNSDSSQTNDSATQSDTNSSSTSSQNTQQSATMIWSETQDFNSWSVNIQISADKFANVTTGSTIQVSWYASPTATDYKKLQFDYMGSSWSELTGGTFSGGHTDSNAGVVPETSPVTYTLTADNAQNLKSYGLALLGYGVVVTKIVVSTGSTATNSDSNSDNSSQGGNSDSSGENDTTSVTTKPKPTSVTGTPFANHGKLHVSDAYLYDEHGEKYQLYGMSTHGLNFGEEFSRYVTKDTFKTLVDDWNTNCIRLVLYPRDYNGYCAGGNQSELKQLMKNGIDYATELGMYVLVDWHVHNYNPQDTQPEAIAFLSEISKEYANYGNVLYEICNEPTNSPWDSVIKPYAEAVIPKIHENAKDAVIIVGTNTWSQDVEESLASPLDTTTYGNVMYTFHFYANSHTDSYRSRVESAIKGGLPIFITEFGTCDASGNGGFNEAESQKWFDLCKTYNISHLNWSLCNKGETASAISSDCAKTSGWSESELTESGKLVKKHFINDCKR